MMTISSDTPDLNAVQLNVQEALDTTVTDSVNATLAALLSSKFMDSCSYVTVSNKLASTKFALQHNLGAKAVGWTCVDILLSATGSSPSFYRTAACASTLTAIEVFPSVALVSATFLVWTKTS